MDETTNGLRARTSGAEANFWYRVGLLIAVWCVLLVVAGTLLILFGDAITSVLF